MTAQDNMFIALEAWISNSGDGSAGIRWFFVNRGPDKVPFRPDEYINEDNDDDDDDFFDYELWGYNEGEPEVVEVRRGGGQHEEAYINTYAPGGETFFRKDEPAVYQTLLDAQWIARDVEDYICFKPPIGWENQ
jgi:hypothetical protein